MLAEALNQLVFNEFDSPSDAVSEGPLAGVAVAFDHHSIDAAEESSGIFGVVHVLLQVGEDPLGVGVRTGCKGIAQMFKNEARDSFGALEKDVAGESVGHQNIDLAPVDVASFHVPHKVHTRSAT